MSYFYISIGLKKTIDTPTLVQQREELQSVADRVNLIQPFELDDAKRIVQELESFCEIYEFDIVEDVL